MSEYQQHLESLANNWQQKGKNPNYLLINHSLIAAQCWKISSKKPITDLTKEFVETSYQENGVVLQKF